MLRIDEPQAQAGPACERLRLACLLTTIVMILIAAISAPLLRVHWSLDGAAGAALTLALLLGASLRLRSIGRPSAIATFSEVLAVLLLGGLAGAAVAMISLRSGAPMADSWLRSADAMMGLSAQALVAWLAGLGISLEPLHQIYESSFFQIAASVLLLPFLGRALEAWRLCFLFLVTLLSCALIAFAVPAYGSFTYAAPATIKALPPGSGTFWWAAIDRCRSADVAVVGLHDLSAVVSFPSFHMIMALIATQAWWWNRPARLPVLALNLAVMFTTLPMGGHYFVDLIGGALVWIGCSATADAIESGGSRRLRASGVMPRARLLSFGAKRAA